MKKIDKVILTSFLGPFILTFLVVVFILLTQHMLKYFDDIVGKDLGGDVLGQLFFYFAVFMTPTAIPLAVLLSSLMTFGNLGEHFELTAIKSAGISLLRALLPIFVFVLGLTVLAFYSNNYFVPKAALEAYSLLYDIKQKKPALELKEGAFYNGIPNFSIKVNKKYEDGKTIEDVMIYDHRGKNGNKNVILADSGLMYTVHNDQYLKLELFRGNEYAEGSSDTEGGMKSNKETFRRAQFGRSEFVLDLSSFNLDRTDKDLFKSNRIMRNLSELVTDVDSVENNILEKKLQVYAEAPYSFYYHMRDSAVAMPKYLREFKVYSDSVQKVEQELAMLEANRRDSINRAESEVHENTSEKMVRLEKEKMAQREKDLTKKTSSKSSSDKKPEKIKPVVKKNTKVSPKATEQVAKKNDSKNVITKDKLAKAKQEKELIINNKVETAIQEIKSDSVEQDSVITKEAIVNQLMAKELSRDDRDSDGILETALNMVRQTKSKIQANNTRIERLNYEKNVYEIQWHKILANSAACIIMFLIGAPLGSIIKRGGLGFPVLISIFFFIVYYVMSMVGEKWAKQDIIDPVYGLWAANAILLPIGLFFLRQARNDARLFDADFYNVAIDKVKNWYSKFKK
ncbi:LptF/LptG family permease [Fulvivirga ligni]|uniref:LptF/LptG family permease n=1 Tax=Fulvivirga ligni TaxID=2904246 RepID=UPI001F277425|nr:LptF/LptG family permease [Fulvivirga ligni]UII19052.1 LptF/LptG family permease [Fulvivirga ligni]